MIALPRLRRFLLWGVPLLTVASAFPGAAAACHLALGLCILPKASKSRKKRPVFHRLFLSWSAMTLVMKISLLAAAHLFPSPYGILFQLGSACLAVVAGGRALTFPGRRFLHWIMGGLFTLISAILTVYR